MNREERTVRIVYTNHRRETATRTIIPIRLWFGTTEWHPKPQWLVDAFDVDKWAADIQSWAPAARGVAT